MKTIDLLCLLPVIGERIWRRRIVKQINSLSSEKLAELDPAANAIRIINLPALQKVKMGPPLKKEDVPVLTKEELDEIIKRYREVK